MNIRRAVEEDIDTLVELRLTYIEYHFGELTVQEKEAMIKQLPGYFRDHINRDFIAYLAEDKGKAVSSAYLIIHEKPANPHFITGKTGLFLNVYTNPNYRKQGLATSILKKLIQEARNLQVSYIELNATEAARPIYDKLGFIEKVSDNTEMRLDLLD